jgi:hypothetical protein
MTRSRIAGMRADLQWHTGFGQRTDEDHVRIDVRLFQKDDGEKEQMFEVQKGNGRTGKSTEGQTLVSAANEVTPERDSESNDTSRTRGG